MKNKRPTHIISPKFGALEKEIKFAGSMSQVTALYIHVCMSSYGHTLLCSRLISRGGEIFVEWVVKPFRR